VLVKQAVKAHISNEKSIISSKKKTRMFKSKFNENLEENICEAKEVVQSKGYV